MTLKPDTVLIGLHPTLTQFDLPDDTPGFQRRGRAQAVISAPAGGTISSAASAFSPAASIRAPWRCCGRRAKIR